MQHLLAIVLCLMIGGICYHYAPKRGRNPRTWFLWGLLFGIFALITLFILPVLKKAAPPQKKPEEPPRPLLQAIDPNQSNKFWYYLGPNNEQHGPMSLDALGSAWEEGTIDPTTYVWNEELSEWSYFEGVLKVEK